MRHGIKKQGAARDDSASNRQGGAQVSGPGSQIPRALSSTAARAPRADPNILHPNEIDRKIAELETRQQFTSMTLAAEKKLVKEVEQLKQAKMRHAQMSQATGSSTTAPSSQEPMKSSSQDSGSFKTQLCRHWEEQGSCTFGDRCQFAHGHDELRTRTDGRNRANAPPTQPASARVETRGGCSSAASSALTSDPPPSRASGDERRSQKGGTPPAGYICHRCLQPGHFIVDCTSVHDYRTGPTPSAPAKADTRDGATKPSPSSLFSAADKQLAGPHLNRFTFATAVVGEIKDAAGFLFICNSTTKHEVRRL